MYCDWCSKEVDEIYYLIKIAKTTVITSTRKQRATRGRELRMVHIYVSGLGISQGIRWITRKVDVRCVFYASKLLRGLYNVIDYMLKKKIRMW